MPLISGARLGPYEVVDRIGVGGMGEVYRARDTKLGRDVALKILPEAFATDPDRLARFQREAQVLASLNHPNIAQIHGLEDSDGAPALVMEIVEGPTLADLIAGGRSVTQGSGGGLGESAARRARGAPGGLDLEDALAIATQIVEALDAAHERGIIHRDLKPANIKVRGDGTVKILDFGLAKAGTRDPGLTQDQSQSPTLTTPAVTEAGMILGTAAYMSPEQARGRPLDRRADIWAFGCVLYEMLTGEQIFRGETVTDTISAVISKTPEWDRLPEGTPEALRRLLRRCLEKRPTHRLKDASDARLELLEAGEPGSREAPPDDATPRRGRRRALELLAAASLGAAVVGAAWLIRSGHSTGGLPALPPVHKVSFTGDIVDSSPITGTGQGSVGLDLAVDGRTAVYLTRDRGRAVLTDLDGGGSHTLFTTPPGMRLSDVSWSPDGGRVYMMTWPYAEQVLSVPRLGGEPRLELDLGRLAGLNGILVRRLRDERWLLVGDHNTLYMGNDPAALEARGTQLHGDGAFRLAGLELLRRVAVTGDGRHLAFQGLDAADLEHSGIADATGKAEFVDAWSGLTPLSWSDDGRTLWLWRETGRDVGDLLKVGTDPSTGRPTAAPSVVYPPPGARSALVSADGRRLVLRAGDRVANIHEFTIDGPSADDGNRGRSRTRGTGQWEAHDFFPDGRLLASREGDLGWELFAISDDDVERSLVRLDRTTHFSAVSRDGRSVAVAVTQPGPALLIHDVLANRNRTIPLPEPLSWLDWSGDGKRIAAMTADSADRLVLVDVEEGEARTVPLQCGERCEFAYEYIRLGPEWPWAAVTSEVDSWIVNVETGELRHLAADTVSVVAWRDSDVYFTRAGQNGWLGLVLFRVPSAGGPEERLFEAPVGCPQVLLGPDGRTLACAEDESRLDLWLVDGLEGG